MGVGVIRRLRGRARAGCAEPMSPERQSPRQATRREPASDLSWAWCTWCRGGWAGGPEFYRYAALVEGHDLRGLGSRRGQMTRNCDATARAARGACSLLVSDQNLPCPKINQAKVKQKNCHNFGKPNMRSPSLIANQITAKIMTQ